MPIIRAIEIAIFFEISATVIARFLKIQTITGKINERFMKYISRLAPAKRKTLFQRERKAKAKSKRPKISILFRAHKSLKVFLTARDFKKFIASALTMQTHFSAINATTIRHMLNESKPAVTGSAI